MRLQDDLRDLAEDVPRFVHVDARAAWASAGRRRVRRTAATLAVVVVVGVLATLGLRGLLRPTGIDPAGSGRPHAATVPTRIEYAYRTPDLPARPGPIAGLVQRIAHRGTYDESLGWFAVSPTGRLWRIPGVDEGIDSRPAISPDGTRVGFVRRSGNAYTYVVLDLVTGSTTAYPSVGSGLTIDGRLADPTDEFGVQGQSPGFFSPNGEAVFIAGMAAPPGPDDRALVIGDGDARALRAPAGTTAPMPAGWLGNDRLVWIDNQATVVITDLAGVVVRRVALPLTKAEVDADQWGQWVGPVSPDGRLLAAGPVDREGRHMPLVVDLATGREVATSWAQEQTAEVCAPSWGTGRLHVPVSGLFGPVVLAGSTVDVVADPRLGIDCSLWAASALDGGHHRGLAGALFGQGTSWVTWWWREITAGLLLAAAAGVLLARLVRRHRAHRDGADQGDSA
jgi:hypothetical protein